MGTITLAQAQAQLDAWMSASLAVANGQSYTINGRSLTRANSAEIRENIKFWNDQVNALGQTTRKRKVRGIIPI